MSRHRDFSGAKRLGEAAVRATVPFESTTGSSLETLPPTSGVHASGQARRRWAITGEFHYEGFCYRIMRRPITRDFDVELTTREDQVLSHLRKGLTNKQIAERLGVSASTVGVLVHRAGSKLHVKAREDLINAYERITRERGSR